MNIKNFIYGTLCSIGTLFLLGGCTTANNSGTDNNNSNWKKVFATTEMQELVASKAIKSISENNPAILHKFTADPAILVYQDTVYIYGTNDTQQLEYDKGSKDNGYGQIDTLNVFSSKDLVNWTDCGSIAVAGSKGAAKWAHNSWAPAVCWKNIDGQDKFFIYFADNGSGIGVVTSDSPTGPFVDPLGKQLISRSTPNTKDVVWLFDPAVFVDDDGKGYLYYGGGHGASSEEVENPKTARCVALADDMIHIEGTPITMDPPALFEDSGINKINGKYYYTYCTNWQTNKLTRAVIAYMVSDNPLGPFEYKGWTLKNPGNYFGSYGNNHHWIFQFNDKWYIAFHSGHIGDGLGTKGKGYRSVCFTEFKINEDGSFPIQTATKAGVKQTNDFNPYESIQAATMHSSKKIVVNDKGYVIPVENGAYFIVKNVNFAQGASKITVKTAAGSQAGILKVYADKIGGSPVAEVEINGEGTFEAPINVSGTKNLYFGFYDNQFALVEWQISK